MTSDTINSDVTMQPESAGSLLSNRYRIVRQLGQGGMGSVWLAEDTQLDNKQFALKMLPSILVSNKRAYRQLKDEALVAMKLTHPNIVTLRAFEENNGNPFLVMDYIEGETLDDYIAEHCGNVGRVERVERVEGGEGWARTSAAPRLAGLPESEVIRLLKPIAAALDYAHGKGVVHRDVKPANVMIRKDGHPFILDFGIAREIQETMTRVTGKLSSGTLLYMSPEQLRGQPPKPAQDVYSFAAMVYECLKGEPPFFRGQIDYQILNENPMPLPNGLRMSSSVMQGLSKTPESRPDSCVNVLFAVSSVRQASSVEPRVNIPPARPVKPTADETAVGKKRSVASVVPPMICLAVALLALCGVIWHREVQRQESERKRAIAIQQAEERRQQEEEAEARRKEAEQRAEAERRKAQEEARRRRIEEESRLAAESLAKAEATEIRIEAKVQREKAARISDADGFKTRKGALEEVFVRAEAFYDESVRRWADASALYKDYIEQSKSLISLDEARQTVVAKRSTVQAVFKNAESEGAKTYARDSWNAAVKTWNAAAAELERMEFSAALETFTMAEREFDACAKEATNNKRIADEKIAAEQRRRDELARQAELQRKRAELRKANDARLARLAREKAERERAEAAKRRGGESGEKSGSSFKKGMAAGAAAAASAFRWVR